MTAVDAVIVALIVVDLVAVVVLVVAEARRRRRDADRWRRFLSRPELARLLADAREHELDDQAVER